MTLRAGGRRGRIQSKTPASPRSPSTRPIFSHRSPESPHVPLLCPFPVVIQQGGHQLCASCASCTSLPPAQLLGGSAAGTKRSSEPNPRRFLRVTRTRTAGPGKSRVRVGVPTEIPSGHPRYSLVP
ncbi:hypothetical protein BDZ89DRAFT_130741 [Hymenopellis radicata]|nr:hypothetical protein BDZ89DRAFT_130741 [Hymenopellis radicata]